MKKKRNALWAWLLVLVIAISLIPIPAMADTVVIRTASELENFASQCVYDAFSRGKEFVLAEDVDMDGKSLKPVPIFCGTFDGAGHTIKNFTVEENGSKKGFFLQIAEEGAVRNLNLSGNYVVKNEKDTTTNFKKTVGNIAKTFGFRYQDDSEYAEICGGIAGVNYGVIDNCCFEGSVSGEYTVGGICGENRGSGQILTCVNNAGVSGTAEIGGIVGNNLGLVAGCENKGQVGRTENGSPEQVGGVAGVNAGVLRGCINRGEVGRSGSVNTAGGICGLQKGRITACSNYGKVSGRNDIGGICGHFSPFTDIDLNAEGVKDFMEVGRDSVLASIDDVTGSVADGIGGVADSVQGILGNISEASESITGILSALSGDGGKNSELYNNIVKISESLKSLSQRLSEKDIESESPTLEKVRTALDSVTNVMDKFSSSSGDLSGIMEDIRAIISDIRDAYPEDREKVKENVDKLSSKIDSLDDFDEKYLEPLQEDFGDIRRDILTTSKSLRKSGSEISRAISDPLERIDNGLSEIQSQIEKIRKKKEDLKKKIAELIEKIKEKFKDKIPKTSYNTFDPFGTAVYADDNDTVITLEAPIYREIAGEWVDMAVVDQCYNHADIDGNNNVGGISGNVGAESVIKEDENSEIVNNSYLDLKGYVKATVRQCISEGNITASESCAGGITGLSDIGWIYDSLSSGEVSVTDGDCAGGISGSSDGSIQKSISITDLEANNHIGGICGKGRNISLCYALPRYEQDVEHHGAICGSTTGTVEKNYFIDEGLPGIDGANFEDAAAAIQPHEIYGIGVIPYGFAGFTTEDWYMADDDIYMPQIRTLAEVDNAYNAESLRAQSAQQAHFRFRVVFSDEEKELASYVMDYGSYLQKDQIPKAPVKDGCYPAWDKDVNAPIIRNTAFHVEYRDLTTSIATGEKPPLLILEGNFTEESTVTAKDITWTAEVPSMCKAETAYAFTVSPAYSGEMRVHIRDEGKRGNKIGILSHGKTKIIECERDGDYLIFQLEKEEDFVIIYDMSSALIKAVIIVCILLLLILLILFFLFLDKKKGWGIVDEMKEKLSTFLRRKFSKTVAEEDVTQVDETIASPK